MDFFIHTTKASDSAKLKKLQDDYKLAGLGFYWKVVELLMLCPTKVHFNTILTLREGPISFNKVKAILNDYDLFVVDENNYVTLKVDKGNGIGEKSLESYLSFFSSSSRASDASHESRASSHTSSGASSDACTDASSGACTLRRSFIEEIKFIKTESESEEKRTQQIINNFLMKKCPHLYKMEQHITAKEYKRLLLRYSEEQIEDVLLSMENDKKVYLEKRSVFQTTLSWLKKRHGEGIDRKRYYDTMANTFCY